MTIRSAKRKSPSAPRAGKKSSLEKPVRSGGSTIRRQKLANGLSVLLIENHKSPVVSVQMWVKTGSADEGKGEEGISHFIEHLVFKGTDRYNVGEIASTVEASGGELNAYTSFDQTVFYVNISQAFSDVALDVIAEMMGFPKFDGTEIDNEREVVIEEIKRSNDSPSRQASQLLFSTVYKKHPYGIPVIGYDKVIRKVSRKILVDYYQSRYIPKNMHLVVAGDFKSSEMLKQVEQKFGRMRNFPLRKVTRVSEPEQSRPRVKVQKAPFEEAKFHLAWKIPGAGHKDMAALDVLALILGQGESSRLTQKLRMESPITNSIGAGTFTPKGMGLFTISGTLNVDQTKAAFEGIAQEVLRMVAEPPSVEELRKAVVNFESEEFYAMETIEGVARKAGSFENLMGDFAYFEKFLKQVYALKPEDIQRVARKYLMADTATLVFLTPRHEEQIDLDLQRWLKEYSKGFASALKAKVDSPKAAVLKKAKLATKRAKASAKSRTADEFGIEKHTLSSGAKVFFRTDRSTPVLSARIGLLGGMRSELENQVGVTELLSRVWTSGTKTLSEADIALKIENMAGGLGAFGGRNSAGLSLQTIAPFEDEALELFLDVLTNAAISPAAVDREKTIMGEVIRSREDKPGQMVSMMFHELMFKGHPYSRDLYGNKETVARLDLKQVESHLRSMLTSKNLTLSVSGSVDPEKWLRRLEAALSQLPKGKSLSSQFKHDGPRESLNEYKALAREQTHIIVGYKALTLMDPRRYILQIIESVLAGQGGRLFIELRDKASLAYSVAPMRMEGIDTGYFGAYIGCSPEKGPKAIEMMHTEFRKLMDTRISETELDRAKRYLIGRHDIDLQRNSAISSSILFNEIYGIDCGEIFRYADHLAGVTAEEVRMMAKEIFSQPAVTCAIGSQKPW